MKNDWPWGPSPEVENAPRIVDVLAMRATETPGRIGYTYLSRGEPEHLTDSQLFDDVLRSAARIQEHVAPGGRALLLFGSGTDFIRAFLGCHAAGVVPVPVMPPREATPAELGRVSGIFSDADTPLVITTPEIRQLGQGFFTGDNAKFWLTLDDLHTTEPASLVDAADGSDTALIQYTSGSTSAPRGVVVGHDNLMRNLAYIYWGERNGPDTISVSWLPMSHDMGLVEGVLQPLYSGHRVYLMSPVAFLKQPLRWLQTLSDVGATVSGGPNFAYDLVLRRLADHPLPDIDLSRWRFAYNGSEHVRPETLEAFCARLAPVGFSRTAIQPLYGMAEATLGITAGRVDDVPRYQNRVTATGERTLVSCGPPPSDLDLRIVDPDTHRPLGPGEEGEIWLNGPCIARGYWRRPEATEATFGATLQGDSTRYLRSGDLGFVIDGEVFISGRIKELILSRGQNIYPTDIEETVEATHPYLRPGGSAAFCVDGPEESAGVVAELHRDVVKALPDPESLQAIVRDIRQAVVRAHGVTVASVALVAPGTIPRTTSGKRQRTKVGKLWQRGRISALATCGGAATQDSDGFAEWLPGRIAALLGIDITTLDTSLTLPELGLDSARSLELLTEAEARFGHLPIAALLGSSVDSLAQRIHPTDAGAPWLKDAVLPSDIVVGPSQKTLAKTLFVTGATGFVGRHIVAQHLADSPHPVRCLVRGDNGLQRVLTALQTLPSWRPEWSGRIEVVRGDLAVEDLGVEAPDALLNDVSAIVHSAAMVNWVYPYSSLAPSNVGGTLALIRLASAAATPLVYLSSMACCWSLTADSTVDEDTDPMAHIAGIHLDYVRTKAVAESLVRQAQTRGLPASIVRPGLIFSHSTTAQHVPGDFLSALLAGCIEMGVAPDLDWELDVCTVDEVANAVLGCTITPQPALHLESTDRRPWRAAVLWMALRGYPMTLVPYSEWLEQLTPHTDKPGAVLRPLRTFLATPVPGLAGLYHPELYEQSRRNTIDSRRSNAGRGPSASLDADLLERTFQHLTKLGYLPAPPTAHAARTGVVDVEQVVRNAQADVKSVTQAGWDASTTMVRQSIIGELTSWRYGRATGLSRHTIRYSDGRQQTVVAKAQVSGEASVDIAQNVAGLCSDALGTAWEEHRDHSEVLGSAVRERSLYLLEHPTLREHTPKLIASQPGLLVLEDLSHLPLLNCANTPGAWSHADIQAAVSGIAQIHALGLNESLAIHGRTGHRTTEDLVNQQSLWDALCEFALSRPLGRWAGRTGRDRISDLVCDIAAWHGPSTGLARTLIHNDFSPRNAALRDDGRLCAYDWELATHGLPQRDLAEFLCFTLDSDGASLTHVLDHHRTVLERASGRVLHPEDWRQGFKTALAELMVTRLFMYAMVDAFHPQPFLERVVRTWIVLDQQVNDAP